MKIASCTNLAKILRVSPLLITSILFSSTARADDFEGVERRLGEIVADGHLSLQQAVVMMHALRENTKREHRDAELTNQFEKNGIRGELLESVRNQLAKNDIDGEQQQHAMQVLLRLTRMKVGMVQIEQD